MDRLSYLAMPDYGLSPNNIHYFTMHSMNRGRGPNRLKYLDVFGTYRLNGVSSRFISSAFNHMEKYQADNVAMRDLQREPLNAINGYIKKTSRIPPRPKAVWKAPEPLPAPPPHIDLEPSERPPHRSYGYGAPASFRRKLTPSPSPRQSRSPSPAPQSREASPQPALTAPLLGAELVSLNYGGGDDQRRRSSDIEGAGTVSYGETIRVNIDADGERPPHRTQGLSPRGYTSPNVSPITGRKEYGIPEIDRVRNPNYFIEASIIGNKGKGATPAGRTPLGPIQQPKGGHRAVDMPPYRNSGYGIPSQSRQLGQSKGGGRDYDDLLMSAKKLVGNKVRDGPPKKKTILAWIKDDAK